MNRTTSRCLSNHMQQHKPGTPGNSRPETISPASPSGVVFSAVKRQRDSTPSEAELLPSKRTKLNDDTAEIGIQHLNPERPHQLPFPNNPFLEDVDPQPSIVCNWLNDLQVPGPIVPDLIRPDPIRQDLDPIPRRLTRSAPDMNGSRGPARPDTLGSRRASASTEVSVATGSRVRNQNYRETLWLNKVAIRDSRAALPEFVASYVNGIRADASSLDLPSDQLDSYLKHLDVLDRGCVEAEVVTFLENAVFLQPSDPTFGPSSGLTTAPRASMVSCLVPHTSSIGVGKMTQPRPDLLYGYSDQPQDGCFTEDQYFIQRHPKLLRFARATNQGLRFPFLAVEAKAAGGTGGDDLWVAANQCAGDSAACLNAVHQLNALVKEDLHVDNIVYSVAADNNLAQLYAAWKENQWYVVQRIDSFILSNREHLVKFRKQVHSILQWGKVTRFRQITSALDAIFEEHGRSAADTGPAGGGPAPSVTDSSVSGMQGHGSSIWNPDM